MMSEAILGCFKPPTAMSCAVARLLCDKCNFLLLDNGFRAKSILNNSVY